MFFNEELEKIPLCGPTEKSITPCDAAILWGSNSHHHLQIAKLAISIIPNLFFNLYTLFMHHKYFNLEKTFKN